MKNLKPYLFILCSLLAFNVIIAQNQAPQFNQLIGQELNNQQKSLKDHPLKNTSNDIEVISMFNQFCFPYDISSDGKHVVIAKFDGSPGDYWHVENGSITLPQGSGNGISDLGRIGGTFSMNFSGTDVNVAGYWDPETQEWTFLGENPNYPGIGTISEYSSGWDITADGETVVGLQWSTSWGAYAMQWNQTFGYTDLGGSTYPSNSSRASGISKDGSVIYGWTQGAQWNPTIWLNGEINILSTAGGEALGSSPDGSYVVGNVFEYSPNGSNKCFIWHQEDGSMELVENSLNNDASFILVGILEDKTCFGWTNDNFPPFPDFRQACIIDSDGVMQTFNDYAESRGLENAQDWLFYSVNAATPDGNIFIGSAQTPQGLDIGFYIDFSTEATFYNLSLNVEPEGSATVTGAGEYEAGAEVNITAAPIGYFEFDHWTDEDGVIVSEEAETTITMPDADYTLTANFHSTVGVSNINSSQIKVYPNPVREVLLFDGLGSEELKVIIYNTVGAIVFEGMIHGDQINVADMEEGLYIIQMIEGTRLIKNQRITIIK